MSALPVRLVKIPANCAKILMEASAVTGSIALLGITEIARVKGERNILVNRAMHLEKCFISFKQIRKL